MGQTASIRFKAIRPRKTPAYRDNIEREVHEALEEEGEITLRLFERTTRTWVSKPEFKIEVEKPPYKGTGGIRRASVKVFTDDPTYFFLNYGTRIRWAIMSSDFIPKTTPRIIGSKVGAGGVVVVGRKYMQAHNIPPQPGIQAREWTTEINKRRSKQFHKKMDAAIRRGASRANKESRGSRR